MNKFQFWMRVNWHVKTWCWKPSEDSQTPRFGETGEKHAQSQGESCVFYLLPWPSSNLSSLCAGEQSQPGWSRSLFSLLIHLPPQQIFIDLLLCARHCSGSWRFSSDQIYKAPQDTVFTAVSLAPRTVPGTYSALNQYGWNWFEQKWTSCWWSPWAVQYLGWVLERVYKIPRVMVLPENGEIPLPFSLQVVWLLPELPRAVWMEMTPLMAFSCSTANSHMGTQLSNQSFGPLVLVAAALASNILLIHCCCVQENF